MRQQDLESYSLYKICPACDKQVIASALASQRKCTQALAKRSRKLTQVFNLRQLASPFGQGFKAIPQYCIAHPYCARFLRH